MEDFKNRHYQIDKPKEVTLPSVYADYAGSQASPEVMNRYYHYSAVLPLAQMEQKYHIRFNEEAPHVIHGRNADGDFEVYKYGLNINAIRNGGEGAGAGDYYSLTQDEWKPYKNYYNAQDDRTTGDVPYYLSEGLGGYRYQNIIGTVPYLNRRGLPITSHIRMARLRKKTQPESGTGTMWEL